MLPFAYYMLKVICCSALLYGYYRLFLRDKIFHRYNRFYLLASVVISMVIPLIHINIFNNQNAPANQIKLLSIVTRSNEYMDEIILTAHRNSFTAVQFAGILYLLICAVFSLLFIRVFIKINSLLKQHPSSKVDKFFLVNTNAKGTPFSFLKYIFWNNNIDISSTTGNRIFKHELAHVQQKHSVDKIFINGVLIFFWCNPIFWLIQKELAIIHEFMADKIAVEDNDTDAFAAMILKATYPQYQFPLANSFFYSPIKRRLIMLTKNKNLKAGYIGRVLVLPLAVLLFAAFTLKTKTFNNASSSYYNGKTIRVVIDASHGGSDFGAKSLEGQVYEKDISLAISKAIKSMNNNPAINIILSRETDIYQSPVEKAKFSNDQHADLFISIHADAVKNNADLVNGMTVWVSKNQFPNSRSSSLLASAIISEFANNYPLSVSPNPQQREKGIMVLQATHCPAVVIETGFITNKNDLQYLESDAAKQTIAKNVLAAIEKYAVQNKNEIKDTEMVPVLKDTVPAQAVSIASTDEKIIPGNALYILDGKILGKGKVGAQQLDKLTADKLDDQSKKDINVTWLKKEQSIKKYGNQGEDGAVEITTVQSSGYKLADKSAGVDFSNNKTDIIPDDKVFTQVENEASFPGGSIAWSNYLTKNLDPTIPVKEGRKAGAYKVIISFIVKKDGSISNVTADNYQGSAMSKACIDLIKKGPGWLPAMQNGRTVTAYRKQPITFVIAAN